MLKKRKKAAQRAEEAAKEAEASRGARKDGPKGKTKPHKEDTDPDGEQLAKVCSPRGHAHVSVMVTRTSRASHAHVMRKSRSWSRARHGRRCGWRGM